MPAWTPLAARLGRRLGDAGALKDFLLKERREGSTAATAATAAAALPSPTSGTARDSQRVNLLDAAAAGHPALPPQPFNEGLSSRSGERSRSEAVGGEGRSHLYSDLGYLLWGLLAQQRFGRSLAELLDAEVCAPLGVAGLGSLAMGDELPGAVECRLDNGKEVELAAAQGIALGVQRAHRRGVPQDGNARALRAVGRLGAHAGLFVTADEMLALGREWLRPSRLLSPAQVAGALAGDGDYALGWARWSASGSSGPALSRASFGHTGFTGGSLWIDPESGRIHLLLAHRLSSRADFNPARREFHRHAAAL
jgi:CubicO group peptidase (beta-lactamase class C family)